MKEKPQGKELKELRQSIGFNQTEFGELTGIHQTAISRYENDEHEMTYNLFRHCEEKVEQYKNRYNGK